MSEGAQSTGATRAGIITAGAMIAHQVAAKAARDAVFLTNFEVENLPIMLMVAAAVSIAAVPATTKAMSRYGPATVVPWMFGISAIGLGIEFALYGSTPKVVAVVMYLHVAVLGAVLISAFWSLVSEAWDPRTAKRKVGRIAAAATAGGLIGGIMAERIGTYFSTIAVLPLLAVLHIIAAISVGGLARKAGTHHDTRVLRQVKRVVGTAADQTTSAEGSLALLRKRPYLRNLGALVMLVTVAAGLLDYVFKARADAAYNDDDLLRFFAFYYTGISLVTFMVQTLLSRRVLEKRGLSTAVSTVPAMAGLGGLGVIAFPQLASAAVAKAGEAVMRSSLFRSGYELLFTPIPADEKRATKTIIDVGFDRLGDAIAGGLTKILLLTLPPLIALDVLAGGAVVLELAALVVVQRLHRGYVNALEQSLLTQAVNLDPDEVQDATTRSTLLQTMSDLKLDQSMLASALANSPVDQAAGLSGSQVELIKLRESARTSPSLKAVPKHSPLEPLVQRIVDLRSGEVERVRRALKQSLDAALVPHVIPLLAWDAASYHAVGALRKIAHKVPGQLVDVLLDSHEEFAVRRRLPRALSATKSPRALDGLMLGLADRRFEVRYQCSRALSRIRHHFDVSLPRDEVLAAALKETQVDKRVWESQRLLDASFVSDDDHTPFADLVLRERSNRSLEHVFCMLSLVLPSEPLTVAYRALSTSDKSLRGTALEYLETILPNDIRKALWPFLEDHRKQAGRTMDTQQRRAVLDALMKSNKSIEINLEALRGELKAGKRK